VTSGWLPQRAGLPGLNGGETAAAVPPAEFHQNTARTQTNRRTQTDRQTNPVEPSYRDNKWIKSWLHYHV